MSSKVLVLLPEHRAIVEAAADGYCEHLRRELRQSPSSALRTAMEALLELLELAQAHGPRLRVSDVRFSLRDVEQLAVQERERLLNQYALGLGRDNVAILVVGTEHAYELRRTEDRSQTFDASRERLLEAAADIFRDTLEITMRPNGSRADANNRMGTFASGVHVGVVTTSGVIRLHIHSDQDDRRAIFEAIATELCDGRLRHPAANVLMAARLGPRNPNLFYLEASWSESEDPDGFGERVAAFAAWLQSIRPRFHR